MGNPDESGNIDPKTDCNGTGGKLRGAAGRAAALWPCFVCRAAGACPHREADLLLWMLRRPPGRETRGANAARKEAGA